MQRDPTNLNYAPDLTDPVELAAQCETLAGGMDQQRDAATVQGGAAGHPFPGHLYAQAGTVFRAAALKLRAMLTAPCPDCGYRPGERGKPLAEPATPAAHPAVPNPPLGAVPNPGLPEPPPAKAAGPMPPPMPETPPVVAESAAPPGGKPPKR